MVGGEKLSERLNLRVSPEIRDLIKRERKDLTQTEFVIRAVKHFVGCGGQREVSGPGLKQIITKYPGVCSKCGTSIPIGTQVWYGKRLKDTRAILVCTDCMVTNMSDKTLARKYLKVKELQSTIRGLRVQADELAEKLFDPDLLERNENFHKVVLEAISRYGNYVTGIPTEEKEHLEKFLLTLREADRIAKGMDDFLYLQLQRIRVKRGRRKVIV